MIYDKGKIIKNDFYIESINSLWEKKWDSTYFYPGEYHDFPEIVFVLEGGVISTEEGHVYNMKENDLILHNSMEFHSIRSAPGTNPHVLILSFSYLGNLPEIILDGTFNLSEKERDTFVNIFERASKFYNEEDSDPKFGQLIGFDLASFLLGLALEHSVNKETSNSKEVSKYHTVVQTMYRHIYDNSSLDELAEECFMSVSYIKFLFKQYAGISPKLYYSKIRVNEVLRLIMQNMTVSEIADKMNFSSPNYLSVFMKKHLGMTISEYIEKKPVKGSVPPPNEDKGIDLSRNFEKRKSFNLIFKG